ncbi:hypothetical protein [Oceanobacter kriegii]|uniref:hypothetical protein n=1 Tax=Oceanobacter kriegii TaxID=64972 RepID=UPI000428CD15|nr:hypothetical protein [Oceanobacter kriegii]
METTTWTDTLIAAVDFTDYIAVMGDIAIAVGTLFIAWRGAKFIIGAVRGM